MSDMIPADSQNEPSQGSAMIAVNVRLGKHLHRRLRIASKRVGLRFSDVIRHALDRGVDRVVEQYSKPEGQP